MTTDIQKIETPIKKLFTQINNGKKFTQKNMEVFMKGIM